MRNLILLFTALILGTTSTMAVTVEDKVATRNAYGYNNSFIFVENGITFSVYPDGEFDFYIDEDVLVAATWEPVTYLYNMRTRQRIKDFAGYNGSPASLNKRGLYLSKSENGLWKNFYYDFNEAKISSTEMVPHYFENGISFVKVDDFTLLDVENSFNYKVSGSSEIAKVLGVSAKRLYLALRDHKVLAMKINEENTLYDWVIDPNEYLSPENYAIGPQVPFMKLDKLSECLVHPMFEVDLDGKVNRFDPYRKLNTKLDGDWRIRMNGPFDFDRLRIVYTATRRTQSSKDSVFGFESFLVVYNRDTDCIDVLKPLNNGTKYSDAKKIVISCNTIYLLDQTGNLFKQL